MAAGFCADVGLSKPIRLPCAIARPAEKRMAIVMDTATASFPKLQRTIMVIWISSELRF